MILVLATASFVGCAGEENPVDVTEGETSELENEGDAELFVFPEETGEANGVSNFRTVDLSKEEHTQELFAEHQLTMINVWGTFCSPCLQEMPDLGEISKEYEESGFQIVGIVVDVLNGDGSLNPDQVDKALQIVGDTQASYVHLIPSEHLTNGLLYNVQYIPYTFFVDATGAVVGEEYVGIRSKSQWIDIIEDLL